MKHTPNPWVWDGNEVWAIVNGSLVWFTGITADPGLADSPELAANKHLVAAAPDMLEALEWAIHAFDEEVGIKAFANGNVAHGVDEGELVATWMINAMKHAIKKAKGEE